MIRDQTKQDDMRRQDVQTSVPRHTPCARRPASVTLAPLTCAMFIALLSLTSCALTQSPFDRAASAAGSTYAAAALTLADLHAGKVLLAYARSTFESLQSEVSGIGQQLSSAQGAPAGAQLRPLVALATRASGIVQAPCLESVCDWRGQVSALHAASDALLRASDT